MLPDLHMKDIQSRNKHGPTIALIDATRALSLHLRRQRPRDRDTPDKE
jgi:hypothetical protein